MSDDELSRRLDSGPLFNFFAYMGKHLEKTEMAMGLGDIDYVRWRLNRMQGEYRRTEERLQGGEG